MGFDRRGYYYRSVRDGDRVRRVYLGRGPAAQLAALLVEERRSEGRAQSQAWQAKEAALAGPEDRLRELDGLADRMMRATLLAAGYHQHDRGAWRRRRMDRERTLNGKDAERVNTEINGAAYVPSDRSARGDRSSPVDGHDPGDRPLSEGELRELIGRATQGDRTVLPALRRLLDARPALWQHCGDIARVAEAAWVDLIAGRDLLVRESLTRSVAALKADLAGPAAPPLERLLAERVACSWMQAGQADAAFAGIKGQGLSVAQLDLLQRRQERTQRSLLAAIKALATVRKLGVAASPATASEAAGAGEARARRGRTSAGRAGRVGATAMRSEADGGKPARGGRKQAGKGQSATREAAVPKALRDRMRGLVESQN